MSKRTVLFMIALSVVVGAAAMAVPSVGAYINSNGTLINNTVGISVSPTSSDRMSLSPGDVVNGSFSVTQTGRDVNMISFYVGAMSGAEDGESYEVETERTRIAKWTKLHLSNDCPIEKEENGKIFTTMDPLEVCEVYYHIEVPQDAVGGSQDAAIFAQSSSQNDTDNESMGVHNVYRFAYRLWTDVDAPGAHYSGKIIKNNVPWLVLSEPITVSTKTENDGTLDYLNQYEITVKNYFGGEEVYHQDFTRTVMADGAVETSNTWEETPEVGIFLVSQRIEMGEELSSVEKIVLVLPAWWLIIILAVLLLLIWALVIKIRQYTKKKKRLKS